MTNAEKFEEVFGEPPTDADIRVVKMYICPPRQARQCNVGGSCQECRAWWDKEYEEVKHD